MPAYCRRAEYEENSSPVLEGYLQFLYASSLFLQKYKARLALEMGFVSNLSAPCGAENTYLVVFVNVMDSTELL